MKNKLTDDLKQHIISNIEKLEYWSDDGSIHSEADEGFVCRECSISISFPKKKDRPDNWR